MGWSPDQGLVSATKPSHQEAIPANTYTSPASAGLFNPKSQQALVLDGCRDGEFRNVSGRWLMAAIVAICDAFGSQQPVMKLGKEENFDREQERREYSKFVYDIVMKGIGAPSADANHKVHDNAEQIAILLQENDALRRALAQSALEKQILLEKM